MKDAELIEKLEKEQEQAYKEFQLKLTKAHSHDRKDRSHMCHELNNFLYAMLNALAIVAVIGVIVTIASNAAVISRDVMTSGILNLIGK